MERQMGHNTRRKRLWQLKYASNSISINKSHFVLIRYKHKNVCSIIPYKILTIYSHTIVYFLTSDIVNGNFYNHYRYGTHVTLLQMLL